MHDRAVTTTPGASAPAPTPALRRRLGLGDAVVVGLASMIGAGVFAVFAPAAQAAGGLLLVGLAVAAVVAWCNASSSAQLAAQHPSSGGTYVYGRRQLGEWWGFVAGWGFVVGKTASCAAMALTVAAYTVPEAWQRPVALLAVAAVVAVDLAGVTRTVAVARVIVALVLVVLAGVVVLGVVGGGWSGGGAGGAGSVVSGGAVAGTGSGTVPVPGGTSVTDATGASGLLGAPGPLGVLQAAGLLFFAFAGYARVATLGEEVRDPARTIPRAVLGALAGVLVLYVVVAVTALGVLGPEALAASSAPLASVVTASGAAWAVPVVAVGAALAALGSLLALVAGVGRTTLAMAREGDLPRTLAAVHPGRGVPHRAVLVIGVGIAVLVLVGDVRQVIGFSSAGVLLYYAVANAAALTQRPPHRRYPRAVAVVGLVGCVVLVVTLPWESLVGAAAVLAVGVLLRVVRLRRRREASRA